MVPPDGMMSEDTTEAPSEDTTEAPSEDTTEAPSEDMTEAQIQDMIRRAAKTARVASLYRPRRVPLRKDPSPPLISSTPT